MSQCAPLQQSVRLATHRLYLDHLLSVEFKAKLRHRGDHHSDIPESVVLVAHLVGLVFASATIMVFAAALALTVKRVL